MNAKNDNRTFSEWQTTSNDIVIQTSNILENAKAFLQDVKNGNTEYLNNRYYEIERHLLMVLEDVKTNDIDPLAFNKLESLFEKLVNIKQDLKVQLNKESYCEFKEFYSDIDYSFDSEKSKKAIEPNPLREIYFNKLYNYLDKAKPKIIEDKPAYKLGLLMASGKFQECVNNDIDFTEIADTYFKGDKSKTSIRTMMSHNTVDKYGSYNTKLKNCIFRPDMYKMEEIIFAIINECNNKNIPIVDKSFKEYERILVNKTK